MDVESCFPMVLQLLLYPLYVQRNGNGDIEFAAAYSRLSPLQDLTFAPPVPSRPIARLDNRMGIRFAPPHILPSATDTYSTSHSAQLHFIYLQYCSTYIYYLQDALQLSHATLRPKPSEYQKDHHYDNTELSFLAAEFWPQLSSSWRSLPAFFPLPRPGLRCCSESTMPSARVLPSFFSLVSWLAWRSMVHMGPGKTTTDLLACWGAAS